MKRLIYAMSFDRRTLLNRLIKNLDPLMDHLIKLYLFPNTDYTNHWRKEVWNFLNRTPKMPNNKFPSYKFIYQAISGELDITEQLMYLVLDEYSKHTPTRFDAVELESKLDEYFQWLAEKLSTKGVVQSSEVYEELEKLGL